MMPIRSDAWFARQRAHALEALQEAQREHSPEEIASAMAALAEPPGCPQAALRFDGGPR